jgi:endoglucanase
MSLNALEKRYRKVRYLIFGTVALSLLIGLVWGVDGQKTKAAQTANGGYLSTVGNKIVTANGTQIRITGLNWFGFETDTYVAHMLWAENYKVLLDQISSLGYNTIRLPYSNEIFLPGRTVNGVDFSKNQDLVGLSPLQVMDAIVNYAGQIGLRIILDRHRPDSRAQSCLWYTDQVPEATMINDWRSLVNRYKGNTTVMGVDLHNEPCNPSCWGDLDCGGDVTRDWRLAAERIGNAILAENPQLLIFVEGTQSYLGRGTWFGGQLAGVKDAPVRLSVPNKLVYSAHEYATSVFRQPWFDAPDFPNNLARDVWNPNWAFIHTGNVAPLWIGETGTDFNTQIDRVWIDTLFKFLGNDVNGIHYAYWCYNFNSGDTEGILKPDLTVDFEKQNFLAPYLAPKY